MYHFSWNDIASSELVDQISEHSGEQIIDKERNEIRRILSSIFRNTGGLPIATSDWSLEHQTNVGKRLLHEAIARCLRVGQGMRKAPLATMHIDDVDGPTDSALARKVITSIDPVYINSASHAALKQLPVIGDVIATSIIDSRRADGPFRSISELVRRVDGLGDQNAQKISGRLAFDERKLQMRRGHFAGDLEADLALLLSLYDYPKTSFLEVLEILALDVGSNPHPATLDQNIRSDLQEDDLGGRKSSHDVAIDILTNGQYLQGLERLIKEAERQINVAMFFMSLGSEDHPNTNVLAWLKAAIQRGVNVKILLDMDREEDPYGSRKINTKAISALRRAGADVRTDKPERLLHSKCVSVDGDTLLIGSHNWTRNSYEVYEDVFFVMRSRTLASNWDERFSHLWLESTE